MRYLRRVSRRVRTSRVPCLIIALLLFLASALRVQAAVFITSFDAIGGEDHVLLEWTTAQEIENLGFNLYRTEEPEFGHPSWVSLGFVPSQCFGQFICDVVYSHLDDDVVTGVTYYYWLESVDTHSEREFYEGNPVSATPGLSPTPTSTSTPTETPTLTPTATPTSTATSVATATPTSTPTTTPTSRPTSLPSGTSTSTPATPATATPTSVAIIPPSPAPTTIAMSEAPTAATPAFGQVTATPVSVGLTIPASTSAVETGAGASRSGARGGPMPGLAWATVSVPAVLGVVSVASFLGAFLVAMALPVIRRLGL